MKSPLANSVTSCPLRTGSSVSRLTTSSVPPGVGGWHVYVGQAPGVAIRQTANPLDVGDSWVMPVGGVVDGTELGSGQPAEMYRTAPKFLQRG